MSNSIVAVVHGYGTALFITSTYSVSSGHAYSFVASKISKEEFVTTTVSQENFNPRFPELLEQEKTCFASVIMVARKMLPLFYKGAFLNYPDPEDYRIVNGNEIVTNGGFLGIVQAEKLCSQQLLTRYLRQILRAVIQAHGKNEVGND